MAKHPQQGTVFNFPEIKLYENETPLRALEDQTFLTGALTDKAIDFIKKIKIIPFLFIYLTLSHMYLYLHQKILKTLKKEVYMEM